MSSKKTSEICPKNGLINSPTWKIRVFGGNVTGSPNPPSGSAINSRFPSIRSSRAPDHCCILISYGTVEAALTFPCKLSYVSLKCWLISWEKKNVNSEPGFQSISGNTSVK